MRKRARLVRIAAVCAALFALLALFPVEAVTEQLTSEWFHLEVESAETELLGLENQLLETADEVSWNYSPDEANAQVKWRIVGTNLEVEACKEISEATGDLSGFGYNKQPWTGATGIESVENVKVSGPFKVIPPRFCQ